MDDGLIERCRKLLEGNEPPEWPVPISKTDLKQLLDDLRLCDWLLDKYQSSRIR